MASEVCEVLHHTCVNFVVGKSASDIIGALTPTPTPAVHWHEEGKDVLCFLSKKMKKMISLIVEDHKNIKRKLGSKCFITI